MEEGDIKKYIYFQTKELLETGRMDGPFFFEGRDAITIKRSSCTT